MKEFSIIVAILALVASTWLISLKTMDFIETHRLVRERSDTFGHKTYFYLEEKR